MSGKGTAGLLDPAVPIREQQPEAEHDETIRKYKRRTQMSNADTFRRMMSYFADGDMEGLRTVVDANVDSLGMGPVEATYGFEALMEGFPDGGTFDAEVADVLELDDRVAALIHVTATYGDKTLSYEVVEWATYENGKMIHRRVYSNNTARIMEFFAELS